MARTQPELEIDSLTYWSRQGAESLALIWHNFGRTEGEPPSWQTMAEALVALDELLAVAKRIRGEIEATSARDIPKQATVVDGVGLVEKHGKSAKVLYDVDALRGEVCRLGGARVSDDPTVTRDEDGCALPPSEIALRAFSRGVETAFDVCGQTPSKSWRTGSLKGLGIDPAEFRSSEFAGWRVVVTPNIVDITTTEEPQDA